jgi:Fic family protein
MKPNFNILPNNLLEQYLSLLADTKLAFDFESLQDAEISTNTFSFYVSVSSVFSSKIEGENIELDSYVKHKRFGLAFLPDYTKKIDDLYAAYAFAEQNVLNKKNLKKAHKILAKHLVAKHQQGKIRKQNMYVTTADGRIEYVAAAPLEVETAMKKLYQDIDFLLTKEMQLPEVFFFASLLHLVFVKIHPFDDGNGRSARLLEKWFLAQKLGNKAWFVQSELYYYQHHQQYYQNIRALGIEYQFLDYSQALNFLLMLPKSVLIKKE